MNNKKCIFLSKSDENGKRCSMSFFDCNNGRILKEKIRRTSLGAKGYSNYILYKDDERKKRYLDRHKKNENWDDYMSAGSLSRFILWVKNLFIQVY